MPHLFQVLYTASTLGIFEELHAGRGALSALEVANNLHTNPDATSRLMNTCAGLGILRKRISTSGTGRFLPQTSQSALLLSPSLSYLVRCSLTLLSLMEFQAPTAQIAWYAFMRWWEG